MASNVNLAVCGKFHVLNYAEDIAAAGVLNRLFFSHRYGSVERLHLDPLWAYNFPLKEYLTQLHGRVARGGFREPGYALYSSLWQQAVLRNWSAADVLHLLATGSSNRIIERAKKDNTKIISEAITTEPRSREERLSRAADEWGVTQDIHRSRDDRVLAELKAADVILVPSDVVAETFAGKHYNAHIVKIPYAANISRFREKSRFQENRRPLRLICVGEIGVRKGQLHLLEAVKRIGPEVQLTLVGTVDPRVSSTLGSYQGNFSHIPRVPSSLMPSLLSDHDVFVLPSLEEGLAVSITEAMATGLAVITTREAGGEELLIEGKSGLLIQSGSTEDIESALDKLIHNREIITELGRNAARAATVEHNWQRYAQSLIKLYRGL